MKQIPLYGKYSIHAPYALCDDHLYDMLMQHRWRVTRSGRNYYATCKIDGRIIDMHRYVLETAAPHIHHKSGIGWDNRLSNLVACTVAQNLHAQQRSLNNKSGFRGIDRLKNGRYRARLMNEGRSHYLGTFATLYEAMFAWMMLANSLWGDFCPTWAQAAA